MPDAALAAAESRRQAALTPEQASFDALPAMKTNGSLTFLLDFPANDRE